MDIVSCKRIIIIWPDGVKLEISDPKITGDGKTEILQYWEGAHIYGERVTTRSRIQDVFSISVVSDYDSMLLPCRIIENHSYEMSVYIPVSRTECVKMIQQDMVWPFTDPRLDGYVNVVRSSLWPEIFETVSTTIIPGFFNPEAHVGIVNLSILDANHVFHIEVMSSKVGYVEEFNSLLDDLAEEQLRLAFQLDELSGIRLCCNENVEPDPVTLLFHLRYLMNDRRLPEAMETLHNNPISQLHSEVGVEDTWRASYINPSHLASNFSSIKFRHGGPLKKLMRGHTPLEVPTQIDIETYDTPENRYVKSFLLDLNEMLVKLEQALYKKNKDIAFKQVQGWINTVVDWLSASMWRDVKPMTLLPSNSQKLQRRAGYQDILAFDSQLREALMLPWSNIHQISSCDILGDIRPIYDLYEYWCFFQIRSVLRDMCGTETNPKSIVEEVDNGFKLSLKRGYCSSLSYIYECESQNIDITLYYNRNFPKMRDHESWNGSYSGLFHPDISISIIFLGTVHWIHFDAKYKLDVKQWKSFLANMKQDEVLSERKAEDTGMYKRADLYKMHCYRDAILGSRGAYILYPAQSTADYSADIFVRYGGEATYQYSVPGVGAFPLRPGIGISDQKGTIKSFLSEVLRGISSSNYQEETGLERQ